MCPSLFYLSNVIPSAQSPHALAALAAFTIPSPSALSILHPCNHSFNILTQS